MAATNPPTSVSIYSKLKQFPLPGPGLNPPRPQLCYNLLMPNVSRIDIKAKARKASYKSIVLSLPIFFVFGLIASAYSGIDHIDTPDDNTGTLSVGLFVLWSVFLTVLLAILVYRRTYAKLSRPANTPQISQKPRA